jgi:hypothetical protein
MVNNPTSTTTSPSPSYTSHTTTKKLKIYLMMILLTNPVTSHPTLLGHPTVIKSDLFSPNAISPNPNQIKTGNIQVGTHGTVSRECDRYFWALTSPLYKAQLFFLDAFYAVGITSLNSTIFNASLRKLHAECRPRVGWAWLPCRSESSLCLPKGSFSIERK